MTSRARLEELWCTRQDHGSTPSKEKSGEYFSTPALLEIGEDFLALSLHSQLQGHCSSGLNREHSSMGLGVIERRCPGFPFIGVAAGVERHERMGSGVGRMIDISKQKIATRNQRPQASEARVWYSNTAKRKGRSETAKADKICTPNSRQANIDMYRVL